MKRPTLKYHIVLSMTEAVLTELDLQDYFIGDEKMPKKLKSDLKNYFSNLYKFGNLGKIINAL